MNMGKMLAQAQKMQRDMQNAQEEIEKTVFEENFQNAITIEAYGSKKIKSVKIDKDIIDLDDIEMLEDTLASTLNKLMNKIDKETETKMAKYSKGLGGMGGGFPF